MEPKKQTFRLIAALRKVTAKKAYVGPEGEIILGSIDLDASNIYVDADQDLEIFG